MPKYLLIFSYLLLVGTGLTSIFLSQDQIIQKPDYDAFTVQPPTPAELNSLLSLKSVLAPERETLLAITGDMILAHVNKVNVLPADYVPPGLVEITAIKTFRQEYLRADVLPYLQALVAAAASAGHDLSIASVYRFYFQQEQTFLNWVESVGWEIAVLVSARPGHSEHQLGTTVDLALSRPDFLSFRGSPAAPWVAENAYRFGFTVSYPDGKEAITGYVHEPWHIRWVGVDLAAQLYQEGITLEEYFSR